LSPPPMTSWNIFPPCNNTDSPSTDDDNGDIDGCGRSPDVVNFVSIAAIVVLLSLLPNLTSILAPRLPCPNSGRHAWTSTNSKPPPSVVLPASVSPGGICATLPPGQGLERRQMLPTQCHRKPAGHPLCTNSFLQGTSCACGHERRRAFPPLYGHSQRHWELEDPLGCAADVSWKAALMRIC
jgi:hypothetical protein